MAFNDFNEREFESMYTNFRVVHDDVYDLFRNWIKDDKHIEIMRYLNDHKIMQPAEFFTRDNVDFFINKPEFKDDDRAKQLLGAYFGYLFRKSGQDNVKEMPIQGSFVLANASYFE